MFIAMNRFRVATGSEADFEQVWLSRDSHLDRVPGSSSSTFSEVRKPAITDSMLLTRCGRAVPPLKPGPSQRRSAPRINGPVTTGRYIWVLRNSRVSKCAKR